MSYDEAKKDFVKEKFWVIELELDSCTLDYGSSPCEASVGVTGQQKCFNTAKSCQDRANYSKGLKTYRYCTKRSPLPEGLDAIPSLNGAPSIAGAQINTGGGLGVRGGIDINFNDHQSNDVGVDPYVNERTYIPYETGTYWGKLRARSPYYNGRPLKAFSGYLVDGVYDPVNFQQRSYVIESITSNRGKAKVTGKDVLKLADNDRSQYPPKSTGVLSADINNGVTSLTVSPLGSGDNYGASGWVRLSDEVMSFTRTGDTFTVSRGEYNTTPTEHGEGDSVQECKYFNDTVDNINYELLTVGANVDPSFIDLDAWGQEVSDNYPYLFEALITEPVGVQKLLKELGDNAPHFLYFDERTQLINFTAVKQPPTSTSYDSGVNFVNDQEHILKDSLTVAEAPDERISDVLVYFAQRDPTKKIDDVSNYAQTYIRSDLASSSADEYGSKKIKTIYSRWINNFNYNAALDLAARKGRRFGITPRKVSFRMTSKDSDYWLGANIGIDHPVLQTMTGETGDNIFQVTSVKEAGDFSYTALEYLYSDPLPEDPSTGIDSITLAADAKNINLRTIYNGIFPDAPTSDSVIKVTILSSAKIGSTIASSTSIDTGLWPENPTLILQLDAGAYAVGKGGNAGIGDGQGGEGQIGGDAIILNHDLTIINRGVIGGGGGGGGGGTSFSSGGGGAGFDGGNGYEAGTLTHGGAAAPTAGAGGNLGIKGFDGALTSIGGAAGAAINKNGYTLTQELAGDIRGSILN